MTVSASSNKHFLVTGCRGMLGAVLVDYLRTQNQTVTGTDLPDADLTDESVAARLIETARPTHIIHCAAYTNVDGAESNADLCERVNVGMTRNLARACKGSGVRLLMVSTDFVFDGRADAPYRTDVPTNPLSVYGRTKRDAEEALAGEMDNWAVARTAWLYGPGKRNFVSGMFERLAKGMALRVVDDQRGCPTFTLDLMRRLVALVQTDATGVFHLVNGGETTWCGLTKRIAELGGFDPATVQPIATEEYPTPATRPRYSVLDCSRSWEVGLEPMRPWDQALEEYVKFLQHDYQPGKA
jgi:dTDP-4-dehydrorhamnose reductase